MSDEKEFDSVEMMRHIRAAVGERTRDMEYNELKKYIFENMDEKYRKALKAKKAGAL